MVLGALGWFSGLFFDGFCGSLMVLGALGSFYGLCAFWMDFG